MQGIYKNKLAEVSYEVIGKGLPVVFLHGYELNSNTTKYWFEPIYKTLKGFQRIYFDLPGMGKSKAGTELKNADDMREVIIDFINFIIPNQRFYLVGLSYGAYLGLGLLSKIPESVIRSLLVCPVIKADTKKRNLPAFRIAFKDDSFIKTLSKAEYDSIKTWMVIQNLETYNRYLKELVPALKSGQKAFQKDFMAYGYAFKDEDRIYKKSIDVPILFLCGKEDNCVGYQDTIDLSRNFSRTDVIILSEAGHNLPIEQRDKFEKIVQDWQS